jgi:hypothetical protein
MFEAEAKERQRLMRDRAKGQSCHTLKAREQAVALVGVSPLKPAAECCTTAAHPLNAGRTATRCAFPATRLSAQEVAIRRGAATLAGSQDPIPATRQARARELYVEQLDTEAAPTASPVAVRRTRSSSMLRVPSAIVRTRTMARQLLPRRGRHRLPA